MEKTYYFSTEKLAVGYAGKPLVEDITIQIKQGEILALIGPNGAGKSTILKTITRYLQTLGGTVYIGNTNIKEMTNPEFARKVSIVFTERMKTELMTCMDVAATGRYPYTGRMGILTKTDIEKVQEAMELVEVWDIREQDFNRISDGQRQRALLARAICQEPEIIVLDEPTSFLDIHYKLELVHILRRLAVEKKMTLIVSMHELDLAQKLADSVLCVKGNAIQSYGLPDEIFTTKKIAELYDLTNGSYNPLFGSLELKGKEGKAEVFVIAGGGSGIATYRSLQKQEIPFITGILHKNDIDYQIARELATDVITEEEFEPIGDVAFCKAAEKMKSCKRVINCLLAYGTMNQKNEELAVLAQKLSLLK